MKISRELSILPEQLASRSAAVKERISASLAKSGARPLTAAVFQMRNQCGGEAGKAQNLARMLDAVQAAKGEGVQLLAFPEMCLPGYFTAAAGSLEEARAANHALADVVGESAALAALQAAAAYASMVLVFGFAERDGDHYYNAAGVIDADGRWLGTRRKNPMAGAYDLESFIEEDSARRSAVFATRYGTIGVSVCFDGEFPESIRRMRLDGAEILVWCNAATGDSTIGHSHRVFQSGSYAHTNCLWVVCCNSCGTDCYGTSNIYSPWGEPLVLLPVDEEALGIALLNVTCTPEWATWRDRLNLEKTEVRSQKSEGKTQ
ncbi:MAG: carbon-nitrogen hydrolase family protein [Armatimonadota bacterium]